MKRFVAEGGTRNSSFILKAKTLKKILGYIPKSMKIIPPQNYSILPHEKEHTRR